MLAPAVPAVPDTWSTPDTQGMRAGTAAAPAVPVAPVAADMRSAPAALDTAGTPDRLGRSAAVAVLLAVARLLCVAARSSLEPRLVVSPSSLSPDLTRLRMLHASVAPMSIRSTSCRVY